ncbi:MAG: serine/threonine-protein kinase [Bacteroidota bacterium]
MSVTADLWTRLATIVPDALDLPLDARDAFLDDACRLPTGEVDAALRAEAAALVTASTAADAADALASPVAGLAGDLAAEEGLRSGAPPETVGPWRVTGVLGEGGQGVVYRAVRADGAFEREVAIKLLRPGLGPEAGARLGARLAEERRVLGRLEHEGIARLYDGGLADDGRPYLAMEKVDGPPITAYADAQALSVRDRVALLADACDAVAYAHARLVVHRDLKPSNVLVAVGMGDEGLGIGASDRATAPPPRPQPPIPNPQSPRVKLLDFGVAKLLGPEADADLTVPGWMTPAYAAPEQVAGGDVTTATDVYALGVLAYEVLAGRRPYAVAGLSPAEVERVVCETAPPPASATATEAAPARAAALRGDLDTILAKALAKEPARRYETAAALAADLRRHLGGLPVEARPATVGYRVGRFVRRHRAGVAGVAAAVLAIVAVSGVAFARVAAERDRAEAEAANATAAQDFVYGMLAAPRSDEQGRDVRVADLLDGASAVLDSTLGGQPAVLVEARSRLANTYRSLGLYEESARENRLCIEAASQAFGSESDDALTCRLNLGATYQRLGDYPRADSLITSVVAALSQRFGEDAPELVFAYSALASLRNDQDDPEAALEVARRLLTIDRRRAEADPGALADVASSLNDIAVSLFGLGRLAEAAEHAEEAVAIQEATGDTTDLSFAGDLRNLGAIYGRAERVEDSDRVLRRAIRIGEQAGGPDHPRVAGIYAMLGQLLTRNGDLNEAEGLIRKSLQIRETALGPDHVEMAYSWEFLALVLHAQGRTAETREAALQARRLYAQHFGADHQWVADVDTLLTDS